MTEPSLILNAGNVMLEGTIHVPSEYRQRTLSLLVEHIDLTRAEVGCLAFSVTEDPDTEGRFVVTEVFVDQATFDTHQVRAKASPWGVFTKEFLRVYTVTTQPDKDAR